MIEELRQEQGFPVGPMCRVLSTKGNLPAMPGDSNSFLNQ